MPLTNLKRKVFTALFCCGIALNTQVNAVSDVFVHFPIPTGSTVSYTGNYTKENDNDYITVFVSSFNGSETNAYFNAQEYTWNTYLNISNNELYSASATYNLYFQGFNLSAGNKVRLGIKRNGYGTSSSSVTFLAYFQ